MHALMLKGAGQVQGSCRPSVHTACPTGSSGAQGGGGGGSSAHYAVNSQFTMGGPAISMASPMSIPTNTMHYGS
jgi:histone-arginine methyltransferase CARM1